MPTFICRFMVITNNIQKYITKIGQNTGMLNISKKVQTVAMTNALLPEYLKTKRTYLVY